MGAVFSESGRPGPGFPENGRIYRTFFSYLDSISVGLGKQVCRHSSSDYVFIAKTKVSRVSKTSLISTGSIAIVVALAVPGPVIANEGLSDGLMSVFAVPLTPRFRLSYAARRAGQSAPARVADPATHPFSQSAIKANSASSWIGLRTWSER